VKSIGSRAAPKRLARARFARPRGELAALASSTWTGTTWGALLSGLEQVAGIEPGDSGVAHQRVTSTLHLLGGLSRDLVAEAPRRRATRSMLHAWDGWESNPRYDGVRTRYKASVCYRPSCRGMHARAPRASCITASSSPQDSNLNLSGFSQVRSPGCAREGCRPARAAVGSTCARALFHQVPCQAPHHQLFGCQRSPAATLVRRTSGVMRSHRCEGARIA
jgi:hypothetical protein